MARSGSGQRGVGATVAVGAVVLLVVAEPALRDLLAVHLRSGGCHPLATGSADEGARLASQLVPDVIVVDLDDVAMAAIDWPAVMGLGAGESPPPIIGLSCAPGALGRDLDGNRTLLTKPVRVRDLVQHVQDLLLPSQGGPPVRTRAALRAGPIELDRDHPTVRVHRGKQSILIDLPITEHRLLELLLAVPERVYSREEIRRAVWPHRPVDIRTVDQYVRRLRRSLAKAGVSDVVHTVNRAGYRLQLDRIGPPSETSGLL